MSDFETHPIGTAKRIEQLERKVQAAFECGYVHAAIGIHAAIGTGSPEDGYEKFLVTYEAEE